MTGSALRSLSSDEAVEVAVREAERLGMHFETKFLGPHGHPIEISHLLQGDAKVAEGYGKGTGSDGVAGGHFEALERYFMSARVNRRLVPGAASKRTAEDVARQPGLAGDLVVQRWAADFPESVAACAIYGNAGYGDAGSSLWYPIFLGDPHYFLAPLPGDSVESYQNMLRYASSLGTASGVNAQEAHLHGLCELIEHDAFSHALLRWFIARTPEVLRVEMSSLPGRVKLLYDTTAETAGAEVFLLDVTTDIGVPAYLAVKGDNEGAGSLVGAGASPIGEHAAVRALGELIQLELLSDGTEAREASARLAAWPALQECVTMSPVILRSQDAQLVPLRESVGDVSTVESSLRSVTDLLRRRGVHSYTCELAPPESLISVISTIAPGLERFSLVRTGVPIIPTGRGWSSWASSR
jgi:ribosomal protein S12 methylthiotransferase accessory factor